ncbi:class I mannose-6-phosphate isomerase [Anaerocolumna xylanovorans]|uniref:Mannose-6-phosphate isomerase, class I n=1 Tax=Anaerocolumna xylanovorans DSM 12503 TaxID=1121345 RepID=A0A1M7XZM2_9FIRM|nr:class I mannose-6-phosphate isomerase [Anaerocolumna xylanovorans]SHO44669.1 Mannose-6-phosphate isomerase, class I [Anaerocolumna xylanovorans DSM 12503]
MKYRDICNYNKYPFIEIKDTGCCAWQGYDDIISEVKDNMIKKALRKTIIVVDCYPGVYDDEILPVFVKGLMPVLIIEAKEALLSQNHIDKMLERNITDDRVFGVLSCHKIQEFFDDSKIIALKEKIDTISEGPILIYGTGACLIGEPDILVYADLARWEIQQRYRNNKIANWCSDNYDEDILKKYKRGFFVDWRVNDRHKKDLFDRMDYVLDTNKKENPKMVTGKAMLTGLQTAVEQPFRVVPFFDPGVWGGQWMKDVCGLDREVKNFAWCFDCVPEENSLLLKANDIIIEIPSINLVFYKPKELLGDKVHARFGTEFPIRFDFLDTMEGQNLSLQVHPLTEYIQENFGMHYTQDESYYILDAIDEKNPVVYLGVKENVNPEEMINDLEKAQTTGVFDALKYVNEIPAKKHDHFLVPAGTIHCSGANTMVLEISATPFIFTFKLWDWDRLGLDGKPRPVHVSHGKKNIQFDRDTSWIYKNCVNHIELIESGDGFTEERTGLHQREFIETRRHWFTKKVYHNTHGGVNVLNLIEGEEALVESPKGRFEPFEIHYAETFIIPANVGEYTIRPHGRSEGKKIATIKAYVRT